MTSSPTRDGTPLLDEVIARLNGISELRVQLSTATKPDQLIDAFAEVTSPIGTAKYACVVRNLVRPSMLGALAAEFLALRNRGAAAEPLLVTSRVSGPVGQALKASNIQFADAAGNAFLSSPAVFVFVQGCKVGRPATVGPRTAMSASKLRVLYVLLRNEALRTTKLSTIAQAAGVSVAATSYAIRDLRAAGIIAGTSRRGITVPNFRAALGTWDVGYATQVRPKLKAAHLTRTGQTVEQLIDAIVRLSTNHASVAIGGEWAASRLTSVLRTGPVTIHASLPATRIMAELRLKPDPNGDVVHLAAVSSDDRSPQHPGQVLADPILVRSELLAAGGSRLVEAAESIWEQWIEPREAPREQ